MQSSQLTTLSPLRPAYASILAVPSYPISPSEHELVHEHGVSDVVNLACNENPAGCSSHVTLAITEQLGQLARYPDSKGQDLKQALADLNEVAVDQITLGHGSGDVLDRLARGFVGADDGIVYGQYASLLYPMMANRQGATATEVPARRFGHDLEAMAQAVQENPAIKMVIIANPNNPTGTQLSPQALRAFVASIPPSVLVVVDEAYIEYSPNTTNRALLDAFAHVVIVRTFSNAYGLAGLRVGYALSSVAVAAVLSRTRQPSNISRVGLAGATAAVADQGFIEQTRLMNDEQMHWMEQQFDGLGLAFIKSYTNFMMIKIEMEMEDITAISIHQALLEQGIITRLLTVYGLPDWLRITIGSAEDNVRLIDTLRSILTAN